MMENESSIGIPEWKKILIMKKRAHPSTEEGVDLDSSFVKNECYKFCGNKKITEISLLKTVTIGNINVELRSVAPEKDSQANATESDEDLQYGPGIVDRLKTKFLNIGVKQQRKPIVRRFSSLENLPGSGTYRTYSRTVRQNGFKSCFNHVKKAQSMETLNCTTTEQQIFPSGRRTSTRTKGLIFSRNVFTNVPEFPCPRWEGSTPNINEDELPKPDTVKHVKKLFEPPPTEPRFSKTSPTLSGCNGAKKESVVKTNCNNAKVTCAKVSTPESEKKTSQDFEINNLPLLVNDLLSVNKSCENSTEDKNVLNVTDELSHSEASPSERSMVVANSSIETKKTSWKTSLNSCTTSITFDFRGRTDVQPHIALQPPPFGCRRATSPPAVLEDWDEMDIGADLPLCSGIVFAGENVKIGKGAFLETRNKKLNIQFNDEAISTFEYPSETSPQEETSLESLVESAANSRLSNYTPHVLSNNGEEFELGISQSNHKTSTFEKEDFLNVLLPVDSNDSLGWSATQTSDILF